MSYSRPPVEDEFVKSCLKDEIHALGVSSKIYTKFIDYAVSEAGADPDKFPPRLRHVIKGRTPPAYIAMMMVKFFGDREYEDFVRTKKEYIEYITDCGDTKDLEIFSQAHPLHLRITKVRLTSWVVSGEPNSLDIYLRSPIRYPEGAEIDPNDYTKILNERLLDFAEWLESAESVPRAFQPKEGNAVPVKYWPDWLKISDEDGFVESADLSGHVDIMQGVLLLEYSKNGAASNRLPTGLDTFYALRDLLVGNEANPAPKDLSFEVYWPRIVKGQSDFAEIFFRHLDAFPKELKKEITAFFDRFSETHRKLLPKAELDLADLSDVEEAGEFHVPSPTDFAHYQNVEMAFFDSLQPVLAKHWEEFVKTTKRIFEIEKKRAQKHFEKMKSIFPG